MNPSRPVEFETKTQAAWSHIDPYFHLNSEYYLHYFINHRLEGIQKFLGISLEEFFKYPFGIYLNKLSMEFVRPVYAGKTITIKSRVVEFSETACVVTAEMFDESEKVLCQCVMHYTCVDKKTGRPISWEPAFVAKFCV